jgi:hypothetical protein
VIFRVKIQSNLPVQSETSVRLRQEDAVSSIHFNLALENVIRDKETETKGTIYTKSTLLA